MKKEHRGIKVVAGLVATFILISMVQLTGCRNVQDKTSSTAVPMATEKKVSASAYKADYLEACDQLADRYIYLEKKLGISREAFRINCRQHAETVEWQGGRPVFIREMWQLKSKFADSHLEWTLSKSELPFPENKYLGFTATVADNGDILVERVYPYFTKKVQKGDRILTWNGKPVSAEMERLCKLNPQSTPEGTREKAARRLSIDYRTQPMQKDLSDVTLKIRHKGGNEETVHLKWQDCELTLEWPFKLDSNSNQVAVTHGKIPSLEEIPTDAQAVTEALPYYFRTSQGKKVAVLHPRSFWEWTAQDLDETMRLIKEEHPALIVVDLKDTAGGAFDQVLMLSRSLGVDKPFKYAYDVIDEKTLIRSQGRDDFETLASSFKLKHIWRGQVIFRTNSIVVSAGDFFTSWMKQNHRGRFVGQATSGGGGGTTDYELSHTGTELSIPMRDRQIEGSPHGIEGFGIEPDKKSSLSIEELLQTFDF